MQNSQKLSFIITKYSLLSRALLFANIIQYLIGLPQNFVTLVFCWKPEIIAKHPFSVGGIWFKMLNEHALSESSTLWKVRI